MATNLKVLGNRGSEALAFLEFIVSGAPPASFVCIAGINKAGKARGEPPKVTPAFFRVYELQAMVEYAEKLYASGLDVYMVPSMMREKPSTGRGTKDYFAGSTVLWVDIDYKDGGSVEKTLEDFAMDTIPPSWVVASGNGVHCYWKLDSFLSPEDTESRNRFLCKRRFKCDDCFSIDHLMRIPGFTNKKDPTNVKQVKTVRKEGHIYSASDFEILGSDDAPEFSGQIEEEDFDTTMIDRLPEELRERIVLGPQGEDRSSNDWFVCCALLENGYTPGQVLSVLLWPGYQCGEKAKENIAYAFRTIRKATAEAKRRIAMRPKALLQSIIDRMLYTDSKGHTNLDLPIQGLGIINEACQELERNGYRFVYDDTDNTPYIICADGEIIRANANERGYNGWISHITMFTAESRAFRMFQSGIVAYCQHHGAKSRIRPWAFLDLDRARFYVLLDHEKASRIAYVSANSALVTLGGNGTDNIMMFPSEITFGHNLDVEEDLSNIDLSQTLSGLFDLTYEYFAVPQEVKAFLAAYMLAVPIAGTYVKHGMLPLLHLTGKAGQGKTEALKILSAWIHGSVTPESGSTLPSVRSIASKDVLLPFDDYEELSKPMKEFILTSATGAVRHKADPERMGVVSQKNHILIALSSVADLNADTLRRRTLRVEVSHGKHPTKNFSSVFKDKILRNRNRFWNGYLLFVAKHILGKLSMSNYHALVEKVTDQISVSEFRPMGEFLALVWFICQQLGKIDPRFAKYTEDVESIKPWLNYFELLNAEILDSYSTLLGSLEHIFQLTLRDMNDGVSPSGVVDHGRIRTVTGSTMCRTPLWMQGLYLELPRGLPENLPFDPKHTLCVSGKVEGWLSTLRKTGEQVFDSASLPKKQILAQLKNLTGITSKVSELQLATQGGFRYSGVYRLGTSDLYLQFVIHSSPQNPIVRLFYAVDPELYTAPAAPQGVRPIDVAKAAADIKSKIQTGKFSKSEVDEMIGLLKLYKDKMND